MSTGMSTGRRRWLLWGAGGAVIAGAGLATGRGLRRLRRPPAPPALSYAPPPGARRAPPEPGRRYAVPITGAPATGAAQPLVVLVTFSDFECPYCLGLHRNLQVLRRERPDVRLAWRDFPLPGHQRALPAALWARAAGARGKFWPMTDLLFERQHQLDLAALAAPVRALGLEPAQLERAARDPRLLATVQADVTLALSLALPGTPSVFANGRLVTGAHELDHLREVVDDERARAARLLAGGVPHGDLYATLARDAVP
jgi:protein-disulfide isomerase